MSEGATLRLIATAVAAGRVQFTYHALNESMPDRGLAVSDVLHVLENATSAEPQDEAGTKWKVYGQILNSDELAVVVRIRERSIVIVITAHPPP